MSLSRSELRKTNATGKSATSKLTRRVLMRIKPSTLERWPVKRFVLRALWFAQGFYPEGIIAISRRFERSEHLRLVICAISRPRKGRRFYISDCRISCYFNAVDTSPKRNPPRPEAGRHGFRANGPSVCPAQSEGLGDLCHLSRTQFGGGRATTFFAFEWRLP
ncbi:hypothetical protein Pla100_42250 [Neorhodopirellula pilleata]|uniref:Uncharacterized protein n=1 Tax=Neorhodopirellula pilleata TaxID=2714738 RepID=A0A5C6A301_9BACT|nr:hypothetical protein Pla100_42250 [Neorhodopirellula pilleata]